MKKHIVTLLVIVFAINTSIFSQTAPKAIKNLELTGTITSTNASNLELADCIANSAMIMGVTSYTQSESDATESAYVKGNYSYGYYVNNYETEAGNISFNYSYTIKDNVITYRFYDFKHDGSNTSFASIGAIPDKWNATIGKVFTQKQYAEIMKDLLTNSVNAIHMIKKHCAK